MSTPGDHDERMARSKLSLAGLSIGDAFGEQFFRLPEVEYAIKSHYSPLPPWHYTDDTEMALAIFEVLRQEGRVDQDALAIRFAQRYAKNPGRGYGATVLGILESIGEGLHWREVSLAAFDGMGSMGNGGAMRVAPLGAYFADDLKAVVEQARLSAEVTHAHPEGQAGAIAVAVAAAFAWNARGKPTDETGAQLFECVLAHTPPGETHDGILKAAGLPRDLSVPTAVHHLGNGSRVISQDTVPFCLWSAARHLDNYGDALWTTVSGLGDRDTTCAIVGGIVALSAGEKTIPGEWLQAREPLQW
jgi:ADP-ribosylglycohydrolase